MNTFNISSMTILLHQYQIEKLVNKIQHNCSERRSIIQKSEQDELEFYMGKQQSQQSKIKFKQPMSARNLYFTPIKKNKFGKPNKQKTEQNNFDDCFDKIDGDQSNLLTIILQLQDQIKSQNNDIEHLNDKCQQLEYEKEQLEQDLNEQQLMTSQLLQKLN